jgi:hypothetical protein
MQKILKILFMLYAVTTFVFGLPLFLAPGRFLGLFGWEPIEPLLLRLLGAALIAMAWCALHAFLAPEPDQVQMVVTGNLIFTSLGAIGFLRHLTGFYYPFMVWFVFILLAVWAIIWAVVWFMLRKKRS